ncbi:MAG TPA: hypothetical protein VIQ77_07810, partial [Mucilaginibacter sp.]
GGGQNYPITMTKYSPITFKSFLIVVMVGLAPFAANAQQELAASFERFHDAGQTVSLPAMSLKNRAEKQQLLDFLKQLHLPDVPYNEPADQQWNKLAGLFTRLRLYPLAMKCFLKTLTPDSLARNIPVTDDDQFNIERRLKRFRTKKKRSKEMVVKVDQIVETFHDDKPALAYAMILHVKQPLRGTPKVHNLVYTGHTFITLIKFNKDSSYAVLSFGFGPHKDNLLSATPLMPSTSSKFTDDGSHDWDEVVGKFISKRRFEKILELTRQYDGLNYHLSTNNCTDFGLKAAEMAGLKIRDTKSSWLLGGGNNPGATGESILLGKFTNTDTGNLDRLYIDTTRNTLIKRLLN